MGVSEVSQSSHGASMHGSSHSEGGYKCFCPPSMLESHDSYHKSDAHGGQSSNMITRKAQEIGHWFKSLFIGTIAFPKTFWKSLTGGHHHHEPHLDPAVAKQLFCVPPEDYSAAGNPFSDHSGHHGGIREHLAHVAHQQHLRHQAHGSSGSNSHNTHAPVTSGCDDKAASKKDEHH